MINIFRAEKTLEELEIKWSKTLENARRQALLEELKAFYDMEIFVLRECYKLMQVLPLNEQRQRQMDNCRIILSVRDLKQDNMTVNEAVQNFPHELQNMVIDIIHLREKMLIPIENAKSVESGQEKKANQAQLLPNNDMEIEDEEDSGPDDIFSLTNNATNRRLRGTNWFITIAGQNSKLNKIMVYLENHSVVKALMGRIEKTNEYSFLQTLLKYNKQTSESTVRKLLTASQTDIPQTDFCVQVLKDSQVIEDKFYQLKNEPTEGVTCFEKGTFVTVNTRIKQIEKAEAVNLMKTIDLDKARQQWAELGKPYEIFKKAEKQFLFEEKHKIANSGKSAAVDLIKLKGRTEANIEWIKNKKSKEEFKKAEEYIDEEENDKIKIMKFEQANEMLSHLKPWQKKVYDICSSEKPDQRTIHVVLDKQGNTGKTALQHMFNALCEKEVLNLTFTTEKDMLYEAAKKKTFKLVQINVEREKNRFKMGPVEKIKDGEFASMKYQGRMVRNTTPHVFIYTNNEPNWNDLTEDRWKIIHLDSGYQDGFDIFDLKAWRKRKSFLKL